MARRKRSAEPTPPPGKRRWFVYWINGRLSKYAHSVAVQWTRKEDGQGVSLCGVNPYEHAPEALTVGFMPATDEPRCPDCIAKGATDG